MKSNKKDLLGRLDKATDRAASLAISRGFPIRMSKKTTIIGNVIVEKNSIGLYNVTLPNKTILYENISVFDIAVIVAQRYNSEELSVIKKVLALEERFVKHHTDMINYLNCLKGAKKHHDTERMAILEDKFQVAEIAAKHIRNSIAVFKRLK